MRRVQDIDVRQILAGQWRDFDHRKEVRHLVFQYNIKATVIARIGSLDIIYHDRITEYHHRITIDYGDNQIIGGGHTTKRIGHFHGINAILIKHDTRVVQASDRHAIPHPFVLVVNAWDTHGVIDTNFVAAGGDDAFFGGGVDGDAGLVGAAVFIRFHHRIDTLYLNGN